jgi:beta-lactamase class A
MIAHAAPPPPPVLLAPPIAFGRASVRIGPRTTRIWTVVDGRAGRARPVRKGPRRVSVALPRGTHAIRIVAFGPGGVRSSRSRRVVVLPARGRRAGRVPGFLDGVLQSRMTRLAGGLPAVGGIYVQHLVTGCGAAVNADAQFPAASTLKAATLIEAVRQGRARQLGGLLDQMIIPSDDRAANAVLARVGGGSEEVGGARVTETLHRLGLRRSLVRRGYILDARRPIPVTATSSPALFTNVVSTPYELARLMVAVHRGMIGRGGVGRLGIGEAAARRELGTRLISVSDRTKLAAGLPADVVLMHKTGFTTEVKHDAGIVYAPSGPIVVAVMTWNAGGVSDATGDPFIAAVARTAYARLSGGGACEGLPLR